MEECKPSKFPMEQNCNLRPNDADPDANPTRYRRLLGRLLYLTVNRPDITYAVNTLCQFMTAPKQTHVDAADRILRYLKMTPGQGILLPKEGSLSLQAYCDADWGGCPLTQRSCTGYMILLGGSPISWKTKRQTVVAKSSAEAEYKSMAAAVSEIIWLRWLLSELKAAQTEPTQLFCDN